MNKTLYDVIIIGAGPAGIQAAIHASRKKTSVLLLGRINNSALYNAHVENYACISGVNSGKDLLEAGFEQLRKFDTEILAEDVLKITQQENLFNVEIESGAFLQCRSVIFAMGVSKKKLAVSGEKELVGRGVSYCVDCDANFYRGATVAVVGNRSAAVDGALTLLGYAAKVYLITDTLDVSKELLERLNNSEVQVVTEVKIEEITGENALSGVLLDNGERLELEGLFIELGSKGALELATQIGVMLDTDSFKFIQINRKCETNIAGIYSAGDITGPPYQMAKAVGEGCIAGMEAATYSRKQKKFAEVN
ncbi:MAG: NAD(P)/FAD-dependent oxidoreductase [Desulfobulbaceae bacterium]|nr:NAD(P)/FAD-dependent oxidoreductase [Desulfobulbaceae bacterium]